MRARAGVLLGVTTVVKAEIASEGGLRCATSDDVFGLNLAGRDREACCGTC